MQNSVLFGILLSLLARPFTAPELAEKYEISTRSVYRYLDTLETAGIPLLRRTGKNGGYSLDSAHFIDKSYFTAAEYRYLGDLLTNAKLGGKLASEVLTKFEALARMQSSDCGYRIAPANLVIDADSWTDTGGKTKEVNAAIEARRVMRIAYIDGDLTRTERAIEPHTLVFKQSAWYVYAYCRLRADWRLFALSRMAEYSVSEETFARRAYDLDRVPWRTLSNIALVSVEIRFDPDVSHLVADWLGASAIEPRTSSAAVKLPDGGADTQSPTFAREADNSLGAATQKVTMGTALLYARAKLPLNHATVTKLLSFGDAIEVLSPPELREKIAAALSFASRLYN